MRMSAVIYSSVPSGTGYFSQSGGTVNIFQLFLSWNTGSSGTYILTNGTLQVGEITNDFPETIGNNDIATFTQSGGTHHIGGLTRGLFSLVMVPHTHCLVAPYSST